LHDGSVRGGFFSVLGYDTDLSWIRVYWFPGL